MFNGMWKDGEPEAQPQGTYRMAINAVKEPSEAALATEPSNRLIATLSSDMCGAISLDGEQVVLFCKPGNIYLYDQQSEKLTLLKSLPCLNLDRQRPIQGKYKIINGCERAVYWNDGYNEDRYFNIDKAENFVSCDDFRLVPQTTYPTLTTEVISGGILKKGAYLFVAELLDSTRTVLLKTLPSSPVYVYRENQSIRVRLTNVDAVYMRLSALHYVAGDGVTVDAYEYEDLIPVRGNTIDWTYTGANVIEKDFKELLSSNVYYDTSRFMEIVHGRLLRGNISEKAYDFSEFQKAASKICTKYVIKETDKGGFTEQGDEVKAYGIVYLMKNGSLSPVFHIPGRAKRASDRDQIVGFKNTKIESKSVTLAFNGTLKRVGDMWVLQYSIEFTDPSITAVQVDLTFRDLPDVSSTKDADTLIQVTGPAGYSVKDFFVRITVNVGGTELVKVLNGKGQYTEAVTISTLVLYEETIEKWTLKNTAIPAEKEFGYAESDELYENPANFCGDDYWGVDCKGNKLLGTPVRYHRVPCRTLEKLRNGSYSRYIGVEFSDVTYPHPDIVGHFFVTASANTVVSSGYMLPFNDTDSPSGDKSEGRFIHFLPNQYDNERFSNSLEQNLITPYSLVDKNAVSGAFVKVNYEVAQAYADSRPEFKKFFRDKTTLQMYGKHHKFTDYVTPKDEYLAIEESKYVDYLTTRDTFTNRSVNHGMNLLRLTQYPSFFNNSANMRYVYVKTGAPIFQSVFAIRYRFMHSFPLTGAFAQLFAGEMLISQANIVNVSSIRAQNDRNTGFLLIPGVGIPLFVVNELLSRDQINIEYEWLTGLYMESRYDFESIDNDFYFDGTDGNKITAFVQKLTTDSYQEDGAPKFTLRASIHEIRYDANKDFTVIGDQKVFLPLPISFDYCSECRGRYPTRILFSEVSSQEQQSDAWRIFFPLNYTDLPGHRGDLTAFDYTGESLLCRMQRGAFMLQPDPQRLEMSGTTLYLGNPQFLGIPPQEVARDSGSGYGGQQSRMASVNTPSGLFWYDEDGGKVFEYSGQISEISRKGMYNFFNRKSALGTYNKKQGLDWNRDLSQMSYDPRFERVILHCHDVLDSEVNSFTVSYSIPNQSWVSFHSYQPAYMFYLNRVFYTALGNGVYAHDNIYEFCKFYGIQFPFQVGVVYVSSQTQQWHSVHYYAPVFKYENGLWKDVLNKTFDKAFAYTRKQSTGLVNLLLTSDPTEIITWSEKTKTVIQADRNFRIGGLRDMAVADGVLSSNWVDRRSFYTGGQGYQDVVPINVDFNKPQHEQIMFRDKFVELRLLFTPGVHKMLLYISDFTNLPQVR